MAARLLKFPLAEGGVAPRVGRVRPDGAIVYQGRTYRSIREVPEDWVALRADRETWGEWVRMYRAIDPRRRPRGR